MKGIILSAGSKNEVSQIVGDIPKSLIPFNGSSILENQLNVLHSCGIDDISVVKGYKEELIDIPGIKYYMNKQFDTSNILYSLFCAVSEMDEDTIIIYGDVIFDRECLNRILKSKSDIAIGVAINLDQYKKKYYKNLELVYFNADNTADKIGKKLDNQNEAFGQFTGLIKCTHSGIDIIKNHYAYFQLYNADYKNALISELLDNVIRLGISIPCVMIERGWIKINSEEDYNKLINEENGLSALHKMDTDWALRAKMYDNIQWVNVDTPLTAMVELSNINTEEPRILDIGTGTGKVLEYFKKYYPKSKCYGVDISSEMMDKIDKTYDFNLSIANAEDLNDFHEGEFDLATARMSMHHVEHLPKALQEVYRVLRTEGKIIICEGVPPTKETLEFYKEVFSYKETRNVFLVDDLINLLCDNGFTNVTTKTIIIKDMSMNNWLMNAGIPFRNKDIISQLHYNCSDKIKSAYHMKFIENDILMEWKFVVVTGTKN